ncbi:hypothetical protein EC991_001144 [Linnemannia zychae]|nr:hypothetical protein EC991_001144 [Linnemannia zychae]
MSSLESALLDTTNAATIVVTLPELIEHIGKHLHQSDLFSCVQVCHSWNQILTPMLWHTVDTRIRSWRDIIRRVHTGKTPKGETEERIKAMFAKHGHRVRHLTAHWSLVLELAALSGKCTQLCSLAVNSVEYYKVSVPNPRKTALETATELTVIAPLEVPAEPTAVDKELPWVSQLGMENWDETMKNRETVEHFWKLVQSNPGLVRITLPCLGTMNDLSPPFVFSTFASLDRLRELDLVWTSFDVPTLLSTVPQLRRLQANSPMGIYSMKQDFTGLRSLYLKAYVEVSKLLQVLNRLSGLEELRLKDIVPEPYTMLCKIVHLSPKISRIRSLHFDETAPHKDKYVALLVEWLPGLVAIRVPFVSPQTRSALMKHL